MNIPISQSEKIFGEKKADTPWYEMIVSLVIVIDILSKDQLV